MALLSDRRFLAINLDHVIVDVYIGERAVLFTFIAAQLGKTNAWLGLMTMLGLMAGGLAQPFFGWLVDRGGFKWVMLGGLVWMVVFYAAAVFFPIQIAPTLIVIANLGSSAFHPAGSFKALHAGKGDGGKRETTATALFFLFGNIGFVIGPLLGGILLTLQGMKGSLWIALVALPMIIVSTCLFLAPRHDEKEISALPQGMAMNNEHEVPRVEKDERWPVILIIFIVMSLQTWAQQNIYVFVPKNLSDLGASASVYGIMAAIFMAGSALGNLLGGMWADRTNRRSVVIISLIASCVPILLLAVLSFSFIWYIIILLAGFTTGISFSVLIVMAQKLIPLRPALASGIVLGWIFLTGAAGTQISGIIADRSSFQIVYLITAGMVILAGLMQILVPTGKRLRSI